jgi:putative ABC transport system ATP-binding protein
VSLTDVSKAYRSGIAEPVAAVNHITLDVAPGQSLAIMGRSGSGKSTLLHLIATLDVPSEGRIVLDGTDLAGLRDAERAALRRRIGFVFQRFHLLPALSALDNVLAPLIPYAVGLANREHHVSSQLSGGEQQRVAIARALISRPGIVVADEPTGNLDSQTGADIVALLLGIHAERGLTLIIATHDASVAVRCQRTLVLTDGRVLSDTDRRDASGW